MTCSRAVWIVAAAFCTWASAACSYTIRVPAYSLPAPAPVSRFAAGVGKAEITPPPGIPLGGHGPAGRIARGYWTRLYARAFYFQDAQGHALALVSCDLFIVPAGLRAKVLELVNHTRRLDDASLILSATHTHHSPANYASSELYNTFAGPLPHFDLPLFEHLARQIAAAVETAIDDARAHAGEDELAVFAGAAPGIQRNRAIAPFFMNPQPVTDHIQTNAQANGAVCPDGSSRPCPRYTAVDPSLTVIRLVRGGQTHGLLTFYAVHPTAMTHDSELYSGDLVGVAMRALESDGITSGFFNGAEGDVSPDWTVQDRDDVIRLGSLLADRVRAVLAGTPVRATADVSIDVRWSRVAYNGSCGAVSFASAPMAGAAELGGAEDGRTLLYNYGWRPEARRSVPNGPHGVKEPGLDQPAADALDALDLSGGLVRLVKPTRLISHANMFPQQIPVAALRLSAPDGTALLQAAALPAEVTTAVGMGIRESLGGASATPAAIIDLADEYIGYTTTAEEYDLQQYEGASTLLGRQEAAMFACLVGQAALVTPAHTVPEQTFRAGPKRKHPFTPDATLVRRRRNMIDEDLEPLMPRALRRLEARIPRFEWGESEAGDWHVPTREVTIMARQQGTASWTALENDRGLNFLTVLAEAQPGNPKKGVRGTRQYAALWIPERGDAAHEYYFRVTTAEGVAVCSVTFTLGGATDERAKPVASENCAVK